MGGNLFSERRLNKSEFEEISNEVFGILKTTEGFNSRKLSIIPYYYTKDSFGDLDILISGNTFEVNTLTALFGDDVKYQYNGKVISLQYKKFQVDLIFISTEYFNSALNYYSWNDLNNLLGRIFHKTGFKFGHKGLSLIVREGDNHQLAELFITKNINEILSLIGLDPLVFYRGFETKEDIFKYVVSSPYFNKQIYLLENRNHASRIRDKKRGTYSEFLDWIKDRDDLPEYPWKSLEERGGYRENKEWTEKIFQLYPESKKEYDIILENLRIKKLIKSKFSGTIVKEVTKLANQFLGDFILYLKNKSTKEEFDYFILTSDPIEIIYWIDYEYHKIKG